MIDTNNATFILGVYAQNSQFLSVNYPYFLLIIISVIDLKLAQLLEKLIATKLKPSIKKEEIPVQIMTSNNKVDIQDSHRLSSVVISAEAMQKYMPVSEIPASENQQENILIQEDFQVEESIQIEENSEGEKNLI